jgi:hypothetical protein
VKNHVKGQQSKYTNMKVEIDHECSTRFDQDKYKRSKFNQGVIQNKRCLGYIMKLRQQKTFRKGK